MDRPHRTTVKVGRHLLVVIDALVEHRDIDALRSLNDALVEFILTNIASDDVSLIELNEYIGEAIDQLANGRTPAEVKETSIRSLLSDDPE